jgi:5-methyltetrahydrofolate--homocysteine methyltransferase
MDFFKRLSEGRPIITDGAMGTLLQSRLPGYHGCFELLDIENPSVVGEIHERYIDAGADFILTNTFGGNAAKLGEYGLSGRCREINRAGAELARNVSRGRALVAGDMSSTGMLAEPIGDASYDMIFESYIEQVKGLTEGGADLLVIETMTDLQEAKIALHAAKQFSDLPVLCSMSFESNGASISGSDIVAGLATLAYHGADCVGANCSLGPEQLVKLFAERMDDLNAINVPLSVWSNAGLPKLINGKTVFPLGPDEFARHAKEFARLGFSVIGGCCGTTPEHIAALAKEVKGVRVQVKQGGKIFVFTTSRYRHCSFTGKDIVKIGERLNPTARKKFAAELKSGETAFLHAESAAQENEGADILDINVGVPGIDEIKAIRECVNLLSNSVRIPLMIDSDNAEVIEAALKQYPGCAIVNSINGKKHSIETILPLVRKYGCFIVALCLDESGIHREAEKRIAVGDRLVALLESEGISRDRIIIDPLMLAESAEPGSAVQTLSVIEHFSKIGIKTSLGISNVSFGLPQRKYINNAFIRMALDKGLTAGIINTKTLRIIDRWTAEESLAKEFLLGNDENANNYIARTAGAAESAPEQKESHTDPVSSIRSMVVSGNIGTIARAVTDALATIDPEVIMNSALIPGLETVGEYYSAGKYFLPQMIASANAMKNGFTVLKPLLAKGSGEKYGTVVICTVHGDIHDIGKNIVAMMLENHGFHVVDLGKDVPNEEVVRAAEEHNAALVCLSSLLTTTMPEMEKVGNLLKQAGLPAKLMIGGAVVTEEYALSIGAHYSRDAVEAANLAKRLASAG